MARGLFPILAGVALVAVLLASVVTGFVLPGARQSGVLAQETPVATPSAGPGGGTRALYVPPELAFLVGMSPQQRFDSLSSLQVTFNNPQGQAVVVNGSPGKVASISGDIVTVNLNTPAGGTAQSRAFTVTPTTWVITGPHQGTLTAFATGDRVVVFTIGNSTNATAIVESRTMGPGMGMMGHMHGGHGMTGEGA